jgi:DinB superfamily
MQKLLIVVAVMGVSFSKIAIAQQQATPPPPSPPAPCTENCMSKEAQANYARVKGYILKSANEMPAENYSFKPTPDIRTFARVLNHVTEAQMHLCGAVDGVKSDVLTVPPETADKATIVTALDASFTECDKAYASLTDANISEMIQAGPVKRSRLGLLWGNASHDNEQYATLALYMRIKGLVPPSSEK